MWEIGAALRASSLFIIPFNPGVLGGSEVKVGRRKASEEEKKQIASHVPGYLPPRRPSAGTLHPHGSFYLSATQAQRGLVTCPRPHF